MATAAKKPASKSATSNAKAAKTMTKASPAKAPIKKAVTAKPATPAKAEAKTKSVPAKAKVVPAKAKPSPVKAKAVPTKAKAVPTKAKATPVKAAAKKPVPVAKPAAAKPAPAKKPTPAAKATAPAKASAKPAAKQPPPAKSHVPKPAIKQPPHKVMKSSETKSPAKTSAKPATKPSPAKPGKAYKGALLTDADVLVMSENDYMNDAQLAFFKAKLEATRSEILENARETGEHLKENEVFADPNDRATVEEENMLEQRVRDRERKLLKKINSALARIEDGSYGYCLETGDPIGIPRLLARPTAELSIEAQEKHERLEKLFAD